MPLRSDAAILSRTRTRSPISSRSNCAKEGSTLRVSRPMLLVVLNDWAADTKDTAWPYFQRPADCHNAVTERLGH